MSKMSQLHAELSEQASRLGFQSIEEAEANGYGVDYEKGMLVDGRELAHNDWLKRKELILKALNDLYDNYVEGSFKVRFEKEVIKEAIDFIERGEI